MRRIAKSQWEFGDLFPAEQAQKPLTVSELTAQIKRLLERQVGEVRVTGEVSNLRAQSSGHIYFVLKDADAQLNCVLFRGETQVDRSLLRDGRMLVLKGQMTVYEPRGAYQLRVTALEPQGMGALQIAFERLKEKLKAEGFFAPERKRPLPAFPRRVGIITSPTGAAIRDVLHVIERRNPSLELILAPCRVQGGEAAEEIAAAIQRLNEFSAAPASRGGLPLDLILITRGGGSLEDLWPFNEEAVARAIHASLLPVVSAIGHEIDFTISDFVADFRAATPSAAAEILTQPMVDGRRSLEDRAARLRQVASQQFFRKTEALARAAQDLQRSHPARFLEQSAQRVDVALADLSRCARLALKSHRSSFKELADRLARLRPSSVLDRRREGLAVLAARLQELAARHVSRKSDRVVSVSSRLRLLGPDQVLARGYSITRTARGRVVREAASVQPGEVLETILNKGRVKSQVSGVE
jgi:exodeoxyribonuclease VII large subunit